VQSLPLIPPPALVQPAAAGEPQPDATPPGLEPIRPVEAAGASEADAPLVRVTNVETPADPLKTEGVTENGRTWRTWLAVTAACAILAAGVGAWAMRHALAQWLHRQPSVVTPVVEAKAPPPAATSDHADPPPVQPAAATPSESAPIATPTVVLQMATFQSSARAQQAIQELRDAGFPAYRVELAPQDGQRMLTVLLGPYTDPAAAERDLEAARRLPGYNTGRLVEAVPALLPQN